MRQTFVIISIIIFTLFIVGCTVYSEKRSEALSQAVFATSDSIQTARFDLAEKYSKEATRLAFPPKKAIKISPIITKSVVNPTVTIENSKKNVSIKSTGSNQTLTPAQNSTLSLNPDQPTDILRLVIPEKFKDAQILVEGSTEWTELLKTKEFAKQLQIDNTNLATLQKNVSVELIKQAKMTNQMVIDLNKMQKKLVEKDLAILQRNVVIAVLVLIMLAALYLRIKGVL